MSKVALDGARAVITGAGSGIGAATALRFAGAGAEVICLDIDGDAAEQVATQCSESGVEASAHTCDVTDFDALAELAGRIETDRGPVDVLVNNAGVGIYGPFLDSDVEDWRWLRSVNIDGVAHGCYAFGPAMVERGRGAVVNVASGAAYIPNRQMAAYCASKAAVLSLSQCLREDWRRHGVGVSVVCPGVIATPIASRTRYRGEAIARQSRAEAALGRGHGPELVAKTIAECVERDRGVVAAGIESAIGYHLLRGAPQRVQGLVARFGI